MVSDDETKQTPDNADGGTRGGADGKAKAIGPRGGADGKAKGETQAAGPEPKSKTDDTADNRSKEVARKM